MEANMIFFSGDGVNVGWMDDGERNAGVANQNNMRPALMTRLFQVRIAQPFPKAISPMNFPNSFRIRRSNRTLIDEAIHTSCESLFFHLIIHMCTVAQFTTKVS
jgi:hypothetical protein